MEEQLVDIEGFFRWGRLRMEGPDRDFGVKSSGLEMKQAAETLASSLRYRTDGWKCLETLYRSPVAGEDWAKVLQ